LAAEDDIAHFVVVAVDRVHMGTFRVNPHAGGKPQYDPRLMLALRQRHLLVAAVRGGPVSTLCSRSSRPSQRSASWPIPVKKWVFKGLSTGDGLGSGRWRSGA
jgi:hypothetical protein